jgi:arginine:pyruvate transaminase
MAQLSNRITTLNSGGSDGWEVFYRAQKMAADGVDVTHLTIGEHDIGTAPQILDFMHKSARGGHTGYAAVPGTNSLRQTIASRVTHRSGLDTRPANVMVTPGGQAGLFAAHMALCNPGDTALHIEPYYATYPGTIRAASAKPVALPTRARDAFLPDPIRLRDLATETGARTLLINSPNNPTGTVYPRATLEAIAEICMDLDMWLISDEVYDPQIWEGEHLSPRALPGMAERTLTIGSMSKSHAMTGSRIGWIIGPDEAVSALIDLATTTTYGVPGFLQDAAEFALNQGTPLEDEVAAPFRRRRALALEVLSAQDTVTAIPSQGAMYLMLDIRKTGLSGRDFAEALLDAHHIAVMPGESFGPSGAGHLRAALTVDDEALRDALTILCAFAKEHC